MTPSELPQVVLARIMLMQSHVEQCLADAAAAERARDQQRSALNDRRPVSMREHRDKDGWNLADEQRKLDTLTQQAVGLRTAARIETEILQRCRAWLDGLPAVGLEQVAPALADDTLSSVRARLQDIAVELKRLNSVPTPDPQLRQRIQAYVDGLAASAMPELQGIAAGQDLRVYWPGEERAERRRLNGFDTISANALLMTAWLQPGLLVDRLVAIANKMADEHVPAVERPQRIAALQQEALELRFREEALVTRALAAGDSVVRDPAAPVEAVLLVRIKSKPANATKPAPREIVHEEIGVSPG